MEWIQTANDKTAKQENSEITNSGKQNDDHYKTANTTKERTFVKNGELTIQNMYNFLLGPFVVFLEVKM